jgi:hypothetical protein
MDGRPRPCAFPEASPHVAEDTRRYRIRRLPRTPSASPGSLREQREGVDMARPVDREMPSIDRGKLGEIQAFGNGNPGGIDRTQRQIGVRPDQFGRWLIHFTARCLVPLDTLAWPGRGNEQPLTGQVSGGEQVHTRTMVDIPGQRCRHDRPGIDQHHAGRRPRPSAMISSTRSEMSSDEPSATANHAGGHDPPRPAVTSRARNSEATACTCSSGSRSTSRCSSSLTSSLGAVMTSSQETKDDHVPLSHCPCTDAP